MTRTLESLKSTFWQPGTGPIAAPPRISADGDERPTFHAPRGVAPLLARVGVFLWGVIEHRTEDDIVRRYEGHSWCDSTERELNHDIMTGGRSKHVNAESAT